jgi:hypothetical protein
MMAPQYELQGFVLIKGILDAVEFMLLLEHGELPAAKASEYGPVCRDKDRLGRGLIIQLGSSVELANTGPA